MTSPVLLPYTPDFNASFTERLEWRTSISIAADGTESRLATWAVPRRTYSYRIPVAPGLNAGALEVLRAHPEAVRFPLWCFAARTALAGISAEPGQEFLHVGQVNAISTSPTAGAAFTEAVPLIEGYPDTEQSVEHITDDHAEFDLTIRAKPFAEALDPWHLYDFATGLAMLPDIVDWSGGVTESLTRDENTAESNTALFTVEKRYGERTVEVQLALPDDAAVLALRRFLFHVRGGYRPFLADIGAGETGTKRWRLASDAVEINYEASGTATARLSLKELP